jgi:hypothetical protein
MIVFIDNEHASTDDTPLGEKLMAARVRIKYRLEDIAGDLHLIVRYNKAAPELLDDLTESARHLCQRQRRQPRPVFAR